LKLILAAVICLTIAGALIFSQSSRPLWTPDAAVHVAPLTQPPASSASGVTNREITLYDPPPGTPAFQYMQAAAQTAVPCALQVVRVWGYLYTMQNHANGYANDFENWRNGGQTVREGAAHCAEPYLYILTMLQVPAADLQAQELNLRDVDLDIQMLRAGIIVAGPE